MTMSTIRPAFMGASMAEPPGPAEGTNGPFGWTLRDAGPTGGDEEGPAGSLDGDAG